LLLLLAHSCWPGLPSICLRPSPAVFHSHSFICTHAQLIHPYSHQPCLSVPTVTLICPCSHLVVCTCIHTCSYLPGFIHTCLICLCPLLPLFILTCCNCLYYT
jgi:hypothetical protein